MVSRSLFFICVAFLFTGCASADLEEDYSNSSPLTFNLLTVCLDKTLSIYSEFNSEKYVLDLSKISTLNKEGVDSFLKLHPAMLPVLQDDSAKILRTVQETGSKVLQHIILRFEEIEFIDKKHVYVIISKVRTRSQIISLAFDLKRQGNSYEIFKSETRR